jgi:hypothetical protein
MMLPIVTGVGQQDLEPMTAVGPACHAMEFDIVGLRAAVDHDTQEQVRLDVDDRGKLRIGVFVVAFLSIAAFDVVLRNVP